MSINVIVVGAEKRFGLHAPKVFEGKTKKRFLLVDKQQSVGLRAQVQHQSQREPLMQLGLVQVVQLLKKRLMGLCYLREIRKPLAPFCEQVITILNFFFVTRARQIRLPASMLSVLNQGLVEVLDVAHTSRPKR